MELGKRAKIFAPFDALRGFSEALDIRGAAIAAQEERERAEKEDTEEDLL